MQNKRMSELPVANLVNDEDYTIIVQDGINKRANREIFKQKDYNNLENRPYINTTYASSQTPTNELFQGTILFHKISKTGLYNDLIGLPFIPTKLTELTNDGYFVQDQYYVHTDNNFTRGLLDKVNSAIQGISVNDNLITPDENKEINIVVPVNLTELTNDGYFVQDEYYVHTDNNFTDILKDKYDNFIANANQPVSTDNKLATMNDVLSIEAGFWLPIEIYKEIIFDGVVNLGEEIPETGTYAVIEGEESYYINKYVDGDSDNANIQIRDGYLIFGKGTNTEIIYYIKDFEWKSISTDLSNYYDIEQSNNRFVQKEEGKGLSTNDYSTTEKNKLKGIEENAQVNVKPDWNATEGSKDEILNKPNLENKIDKQQSVEDAGKFLGIGADGIVTPIAVAVNLLDFFYPVGSYYETSDEAFNPNETWGGEWVQDSKGTITVSKSDSGTFKNVGDKIGSETNTLSVSQLPSHNHTFTGSSHTHTLNGHTHSVPAHAHGLNSHAHTVKAHSHTLNGHTHSFSGTTGNTTSSWQSQAIGWIMDNVYSYKIVAPSSGTSGFGTDIKMVMPSHSHSFSGTTGGNSGNTSTLAQFNTGAASGNTANSSALTTRRKHRQHIWNYCNRNNI